MKGNFLLAVGLALCVDGILLGLERQAAKQNKNGDAVSSDTLDKGVHIVVEDCAPGRSFVDRVQDFCGRSDEAAVYWYSCRVSGGVCRQDAGRVGEPSLVVWQIMPNASSQPNSLQLQNAKYLPEQTEIRWVDDLKMAAVLVQHISHDLSQAGVSELCSAFMMLRPGAFRADIFRTAVLWKYGGLYIDHKLMLAQPLQLSLNLTSSPYVFTVVDEWPEALWNAVIYASDPELPFIRCYIERQRNGFNARDSTRNDYGVRQGTPSLSLTGPGALYWGWKDYLDGRCGAVHEVDLGSHLVHEDLEFNGEKTDATVRSYHDGQPLLFSSKDFHVKQMVGNQIIGYNHFFAAKQVFCDETCEYSWLKYVDPCIAHFGCEFPKDECS